MGAATIAFGFLKTAPNTFTEKGYTAAHREMDQAIGILEDCLKEVGA